MHKCTLQKITVNAHCTLHRDDDDVHCELKCVLFHSPSCHSFASLWSLWAHNITIRSYARHSQYTAWTARGRREKRCAKGSLPYRPLASGSRPHNGQLLKRNQNDHTQDLGVPKFISFRHHLRLQKLYPFGFPDHFS